MKKEKYLFEKSLSGRFSAIAHSKNGEHGFSVNE